MASDAQALAKWQAYINDYEQKLAQDKQQVDAILANPQSTDAEKRQAIEEYTYHSMYLKELKSKYNEYSTSGEPMPDYPTLFEGDETDPVLVYKSNTTGETLHYGTIGNAWGGSGDLSQVGDEVSIGTIFTSDLLQITAKVIKTDYTASSQTDVSLSGPRLVQISSGYDWYIDSNKTLDYWTKTKFNPTGIAIDIYDDAWANGNARPTIRAYWGSITNPISINQGSGHSCPIVFTLIAMLTLPEGTVPKDEPWDYYNRVIKPRVPHQDFYPNGYDPGSEDEPPEEGKPDPDEKDEGDPGETHTTEMKNTMTKFYVLTPNIFQEFRQLLTETVQDSWNNPSDETGFLYLIGMLKKATGGMPEFETATSDFIGKYIVGCKAYPFNLRVAYTYRGQGYDDRNSPVNSISFGYNGASVPSATGTQFTEKPTPLLSNIMPSVFVRANCPNRAGNTNIGECTFLDFEPFTRYFIYLPYVGEFELPARQTVCATIYVQYDIDFSTGTAVAAVYAEGGYNTEATNNLTLLIKKTSTLGCSCSVAGNDIVKQGDQMVMASMGAQQSFVHSAVSDLNYMLDPLKNISSLTEGVGKSGSLEEGALKVAGNAAMYGFNRLLDVPNRVEEVFGNYQNMVAAGINKTQASRDIPFILGGGTNISPFTDKNTPVLRIQKSIAFYPDGFAHMYGYPKQNTMKLGNLTGYFQTASIDVSGIGGIDEPIPTEIEQKMINDALKSGSFMNNS